MTDKQINEICKAIVASGTVIGMLIYMGILFYSCSSHADEPKEFTFKYAYEGETLEIKKHDSTWDKAFSFSAQQCYDYFKKGRPFNEQQRLDIIDICANPKK